MMKMPDRSIPFPYTRYLAAFVFLMAGILAGACQSNAAAPEGPTPTTTPSPTLNFADLPPVIATVQTDQTERPVEIVTATPAANQITPQTSPTTTLNLLPTTPDISWEACEASPLSKLHVGDRATISYDPYLPTRVRTRPGTQSSSVLGLIIPGEVVEILEGPACSGQAVWWKVKSIRKDLEGWVQEGDAESSWLIRTDQDTAARVPPPTAAPCPVNDEALCTFVNGIKAPIAQGDFDEILGSTRVTACPSEERAEPGENTPAPDAAEATCAYWGVIGSGLGGLDLTSIELIEPGWNTYAAPPRRISSLILPPYEGVQPALPASPAVLIKTNDPLWDWLVLVEEFEGQWQISALMMLSRESDAYPILTENQIPWP